MTDPRQALTLRALNVAGAAAERAGLRGEFLVLAVAIPALIDAGLLSLSGDSTQTTDGVDPELVATIRAFIAEEVGFDGGEGMTDQAERLAQRIQQGSLPSRASGTPAETREET